MMKNLIKKICLAIGKIIVIGSGLVTILDWVGIRPSMEPTTLYGKIMEVLFSRIPLIWVIFAVSAILVYFIHQSKKISVVKAEAKPKEDIKLGGEHHWALFELLEGKNCQRSENYLQGIYKEEYKKSNSDFNILKHELLDGNLIMLGHSPYGIFWKLTDQGLKIAGKMHKSFKEGS